MFSGSFGVRVMYLGMIHVVITSYREAELFQGCLRILFEARDG